MVKNIKTIKISSLLFAIVTVMLSLLIGASPPKCDSVPNGRSAWAEDYTIQAKLNAENQTIHRGQTFDVDVEISENVGILTLFLTVKFNHNIFTLTNVQQIRDALGSLNLEHSGSGYDYIDDRTGGFNLFWDGSVKDTTNGKIG